MNVNVRSIEPYKLVSQDIWRGKQNIIKADWNEEFFRNKKVEKVIINFVKKGLYSYYPDVEAKELRETLSEFHSIPINNISVFNGSDEALDVICRTFLNQGDKVVIRNPEYTNFYVFVQSMGAVLLKHFQKNPFVLSKNDFLEYLEREKPKMVYLSNPNNPTGILYPKEFLKSLIENFKSTLFVIDEAYVHFAYEKIEDMDFFLKLSINTSNLIVVRTFSKLFSLAGLRIGYIVSNEDIIKALNLIKKPKNVTMVSQIAAREAIRHWDFYNDKKIEILKAKNYFCNKAAALYFVKRVYNSNSNFVCVEVKEEIDIHKTIEFLKKEGVYVRDRSYIPQLDRIFRVTITGFEQVEQILNKFYKLENRVLNK